MKLATGGTFEPLLKVVLYNATGTLKESVPSTSASDVPVAPATWFMLVVPVPIIMNSTLRTSRLERGPVPGLVELVMSPGHVPIRAAFRVAGSHPRP